MREITHRYRDPLDVVWVDAAARIGLRIERTDGCYASTDGRGALQIGGAEDLDPDDCLAQMIFHELCHSLVEGPESFDRPDWDLDNILDRDLDREHACLRLQATLAAPFGLRQILAPTTEHRAFYDALPADPLRSVGVESTIVLARRGAARVSRPPWAPYLTNALVATRRIADAVETATQRIADVIGADLTHSDRVLWRRLESEVATHASGLEGALGDVGSCGQCAWRREAGPGRKVDRCVQAAGARVDVEWSGCARWEPTPECTECGACCREAYGAVEVGARDRFVAIHPELLVRRGRGHTIRRNGDRCAALEGGRSPSDPYRCVVYADRPKTCRDFARGGENCLTARRRVGLSR